MLIRYNRVTKNRKEVWRMAKEFYDYPRNFETRHYSFERKVNRLLIVYEVKMEGEVIGFIEVDQASGKIKEHSGFRTVQFSSVQEEVKQYFRK